MTWIEIMKLFDAHIDVPGFLESKQPVILYGAGNIGKEISGALSRRGIPVICFLDRKAKDGNGTTINNIPIYFPDTAFVDKKAHPVVITIFNPDVYIPEIVDYLRSIGFISVYTLADIFDFFEADFEYKFWLASKAYYKHHKEKLIETYDIWADEKSHLLYQAVVEFRLTRNYRILPDPEGHQYFPADLPKWKEPLRMIDAGAFDGNTLRDLGSTSYQIEAIVAFEPDTYNFQKLSESVRLNTDSIGSDIFLYPCGVWSDTRKVSFSSGKGEASSISTVGDNTIQSVALDDVLPLFSPTLIKMDIEGAEYEALIGAKRMITQCQPGLAISLYHHPDHIWRIPLLIRGWCLGYNFYLRCHKYSTFDLVLYAMPK